MRTGRRGPCLLGRMRQNDVGSSEVLEAGQERKSACLPCNKTTEHVVCQVVIWEPCSGNGNNRASGA